MKKVLVIVSMFVLALIVNSCDTATAEWRDKYEQEKVIKEAVIAENDSLEQFIDVLNNNITVLYNTSQQKIDSLKFVIATFPDSNQVIARYKIVRDGQIIEMLGSVNSAVINYIDLIRQE